MLTLAAEGAEALGERDRIVVRFAPFEDEEVFQSLWDRLKRRVPRCELVQDPELTAGQCIVESELGRVDESVGSRLDTVLAAILPPSRSAT
jgi:flagellar biosynthesis/type III secretory pathway protein FliH